MLDEPNDQNLPIVKTLLTTLTFFTLIQSHAQSDLLKALGGLKVEEDKRPFVPNAFIGSFTAEQHFYKNGEERKQSPNTLRYFGSEDKTLVYSTDKEGKDDNMHLFAPGLINGYLAHVLDADKRSLFSTSITGNVTHVPLGGLGNGMYTVRIVGHYVERFIVSR